MEFALGFALTTVALIWICTVNYRTSEETMMPIVAGLPLTDYIAINKSAQSFLPHTQGRHQKKRFRKALCPIRSFNPMGIEEIKHDLWMYTVSYRTSVETLLISTFNPIGIEEIKYDLKLVAVQMMAKNPEARN